MTTQLESPRTPYGHTESCATMTPVHHGSIPLSHLRPQSSHSQRSVSHDSGSSRDEQILHKVKQVLHQCGYEQLRRVSTYCDDGRITLQGRISTYYLKQVAQELVRSVSEVRDVDNDLRVMCSK